MDHRASTSSSGNGIQLPPGFVLDEATKNAMQLLLSQQYNTTQPQVQTNDTIILTQNALAANVPTLHTPTIMSYLGYGNTFQPSKDKSFAAKYSKLMEVIDEIGMNILHNFLVNDSLLQIGFYFY